MNMNELTKPTWETQIALVKTMVAKDASDDEFELMLHMARKYNLDPLTKQIWLVKYRNTPANIFTGRDGFLDIAHRSGQFDGMDTKVEVVEQPIDKTFTFYNRKENRQETGRFQRPWQFKATCTIHRKDMTYPVIAEVFEEEYTTCQNLWKDKARTMIGKVAESQALRKAFQISGIYSPDEMPEPPHERDVTPSKIADAQAEFERQRGINQKPAEPAKQEQPATQSAPPEPPKQEAPQSEAKKRKARCAALPKDIADYFKARKLTVGNVIKILDANQNDFVSVRAFMTENPATPKVERLEDMDEHIPDPAS